MKKVIIILVVIILGVIGFIVYKGLTDYSVPHTTSEEKSETTIKSDDWIFLSKGTIRAKDAAGKTWIVEYTSKSVVVIDRSTVGGIKEKTVALDDWIKQNTPFRTENYSGPGISPSILFITGIVSGNTIVASKLVDEGQ